jgi:hypothetical protein
MAVSRINSFNLGIQFPADEMGSFQAKFYDQLYFHLSLWAMLDTAIFYPKLLLQNLFYLDWSFRAIVCGNYYSMLIGKFSSSSSQSTNKIVCPIGMFEIKLNLIFYLNKLTMNPFNLDQRRNVSSCLFYCLLILLSALNNV